MTATPDWARPAGRAARARRRSPVLRWFGRLAAAAALFALGVAVGDTLDEGGDPEQSPTQTLVRTLGPLPLSATPTVTVTVTAPTP